jgi:hypothetical protein
LATCEDGRVAEQPAQQTAEAPGRYQRSIGGGVGAMAVLVVCVLAFVGLRSCTRDNVEVTPEAVDYLSAVDQVQSTGLAVVYPPSLPSGWTATSIDYVPGKRPAWGIGMLTDGEKFVGIRQADDDLSSLLATHVDADAVQGDTVTVPGALTEQWQEWSDAGGDHAYSASLGDTEVLVYGRASTEDLLTIVSSLTDAPLAPAG